MRDVQTLAPEYSPPEARPLNRKQNVGALVIGGDHPGLAVARSLGTKGIPVVVIDDQYSISSFSRYVSRVVHVPDLKREQSAIDAIMEVGHRYDLKDWVLFPMRDETVAAFSIHRDR